MTELGNEATGKTVIAHVDNLGVFYASLNGYSAHCPFLNAALQASLVVAKGLGTRLVIKHVYRCLFKEIFWIIELLQVVGLGEYGG